MHANIILQKQNNIARIINLMIKNDRTVLLCYGITLDHFISLIYFSNRFEFDENKKKNGPKIEKDKEKNLQLQH